MTPPSAIVAARRSVYPRIRRLPRRFFNPFRTGQKDPGIRGKPRHRHCCRSRHHNSSHNTNLPQDKAAPFLGFCGFPRLSCHRTRDGVSFSTESGPVCSGKFLAPTRPRKLCRLPRPPRRMRRLRQLVLPLKRLHHLRQLRPLLRLHKTQSSATGGQRQ